MLIMYTPEQMWKREDIANVWVSAVDEILVCVDQSLVLRLNNNQQFFTSAITCQCLTHKHLLRIPV